MLKRTANLFQRLAFLLVERADEVVVAVVVAVLVLLAEAAVVSDTQDISDGAVVCSREAGDGIRSGFGDIDFHSKYRLRCPPRSNRGGLSVIYPIGKTSISCTDCAILQLPLRVNR